MTRLSILVAGLTIVAVGCGSKTPTTPSTTNPTQVKFTANLLPSNEVPAVTNAENSGRGTATITLNLTRDAAGAITAATADYNVDVTGFPAGTPITAAHIHPGAAGATGGALITMGLGTGEIVLVNGAQVFFKTGLTGGGALTAAIAQDLINNPGNYYFNIHSATNPGGVARGQLVKQ
jgi:CHRD domain-containing protein